MQRLTARLLLLFALAGILAPVALAEIAAPPHACCIRAAHKCHNLAAADSEQLTIRAIACCNHDCCRAVTNAQKAHPRPQLAVTPAPQVRARITELLPTTSAAERVSSESPRGPPRISLA